MKAKVIKITYNFYVNGRFVHQGGEYKPIDRDDYERVVALTEREPENYEIVNCEYEVR